MSLSGFLNLVCSSLSICTCCAGKGATLEMQSEPLTGRPAVPSASGVVVWSSEGADITGITCPAELRSAGPR